MFFAVSFSHSCNVLAKTSHLANWLVAADDIYLGATVVHHKSATKELIFAALGFNLGLDPSDPPIEWLGQQQAVAIKQT